MERREREERRYHVCITPIHILSIHLSVYVNLPPSVHPHINLLPGSFIHLFICLFHACTEQGAEGSICSIRGGRESQGGRGEYGHQAGIDSGGPERDVPTETLPGRMRRRMAKVEGVLSDLRGS